MDDSSGYRVEPSFRRASPLENAAAWPAGSEATAERSRLTSPGVALAVIVAAMVIIGIAVSVMSSTFFADRDQQLQERRALEERMVSLMSVAAAPQSALACLDTAPADGLDGGCERALFATPQSVASAIAYVGARVALLADALDYANRANPHFAKAVAALRKAIESDRFGLVAQVFATRYGCSPSKCDSLAMLKDAGNVSANLKERVFEGLVGKYAGTWPERLASPAPVAALPISPRPATLAPASPQTVAGGKNLTFPSADSIPPVSIMVEEPQGATRSSAEPAAAASAPPQRAPAAPQRPSNRPPPAQLAPPTQLSPPAQ